MTKRKNYDFVAGGFQFRVLSEDYDHCIAKSVKYKYNKWNWKRALDFKYENEHDFIYTEYDCNGSTSLEINIKKKGKFMYVYYNWRKDV